MAQDTILHRLTCAVCLVATVQAETDYPEGSHPDWREIMERLAAMVARMSEDWTAAMLPNSDDVTMVCPQCAQNIGLTPITLRELTSASAGHG